MAKDAIVSEDMAKKFAAEKETPYTRWVRAEGLDIISSFYVPDLHTVVAVDVHAVRRLERHAIDGVPVQV